MDENMNKDDFMNDLYDYLWMPEDEQGALYLLDGIQNSTHLSLLMTIAVERGTSLTSVERACAAAVRYAWNEGYMSADDENSDAITFREMPTVTQFIDRLAAAVRSKIGDEIKL